MYECFARLNGDWGRAWWARTGFCPALRPARQSSHEWLTAAQIQHDVVVVVAVVDCMHLRLGHRRLHTHSILFKTWFLIRSPVLATLDSLQITNCSFWSLIRSWYDEEEAARRIVDGHPDYPRSLLWLSEGDERELLLGLCCCWLSSLTAVVLLLLSGHRQPRAVAAW